MQDQLATHINVTDLSTVHMRPAAPGIPQLCYSQCTDGEGNSVCPAGGRLRRTLLHLSAYQNPPDKITLMNVDTPFGPGLTCLPHGMVFLSTRTSSLVRVDHFMPGVVRFQSPVPCEKPQVFELAIFSRNSSTLDTRLFALLHPVPYLHLHGARAYLVATDGTVQTIHWAKTLHPDDPGRFVIDRPYASGTMIITVPSFHASGVSQDKHLELAFDGLHLELYHPDMMDMLLQRDREEEALLCAEAFLQKVPLELSSKDSTRNSIICFHPSVVQSTCGVLCGRDGTYYLPKDALMQRAMESDDYATQTQDRGVVFKWLRKHGVVLCTMKTFGESAPGV